MNCPQLPAQFFNKAKFLILSHKLKCKVEKKTFPGFSTTHFSFRTFHNFSSNYCKKREIKAIAVKSFLIVRILASCCVRKMFFFRFFFSFLLSVEGILLDVKFFLSFYYHSFPHSSHKAYQ